MGRRRINQAAILWLIAYIAVSLSPLVALFIGPTPEGRDFWTELSAALGFVGLAMMSLQFLITARYRRLSAPFGEELLLHFPRTDLSRFFRGVVYIKNANSCSCGFSAEEAIENGCSRIPGAPLLAYSRLGHPTRVRVLGRPDGIKNAVYLPQEAI